MSRGTAADQAKVGSWSELKEFLLRRAETLESLNKNKPRENKDSKPKKLSSSHLAQQPNKGKQPCPLCSDAYCITTCPTFKSATVSKRRGIAKEKKLCFNCLSPTHRSNDCKSKYTCRTCKNKHHSLLHFESKPQEESNGPSTPSAPAPSSCTTETTSNDSQRDTSVVDSTETTNSKLQHLS